jgi:hypothetical protein
MGCSATADGFPSMTLTLKMATAVFAETLEGLQQTTWLEPRSRSDALDMYCLRKL